jgi:hypothetical protein
MDQLIRRLENIHRALRAAPPHWQCDPRVADGVALCLRELHAVAAREAPPQAPRLRVVPDESAVSV